MGEGLGLELITTLSTGTTEKYIIAVNYSYVDMRNFQLCIIITVSQSTFT